MKSYCMGWLVRSDWPLMQTVLRMSFSTIHKCLDFTAGEIFEHVRLKNTVRTRGKEKD